jgi:FkbM family methyltransferase
LLRRAVRLARRSRRRLFEALGSDRFSRPALDDMERKLERYLPEEGGVFVEAGGYDGFTQSNTYWFERFRGWTGLLIEPVPREAAIARRERRRSQVFECALVPADFGERSISIRYGGTMSVVPGAGRTREEELSHAEEGARMTRRDGYDLEVPARTLSSVLDEAGIESVDLLSLDVEGFEASVLRGLDLARHAPRFLLVEMLDEGAQREEIEAVLGDRFTYEEALSVRDHLYRRV